MIRNVLTLTIVIPVYNEENHLKACLDSIAKQTFKPIEIIVVDNNSSDKSVAVAGKYKFVKVLHEKRQGQVFAQSTGFNSATGQLLGRIDADSILPVDWAEKVINYFDKHPLTVAITGDPDPYDIVLKRLGLAVFHFYHSGVSRFFSGRTMLWGANSALRHSSWNKIKKNITYRTDIWEDYDMAFLLSRYGKVRRLKSLTVGCSFRSAQKSLIEQTKYQYRAVRTLRIHVGWLRSEGFFLVKCTMFLPYILILVDNVLLGIKRLAKARR